MSIQFNSEGLLTKVCVRKQGRTFRLCLDVTSEQWMITWDMMTQNKVFPKLYQEFLYLHLTRSWPKFCDFVNVNVTSFYNLPQKTKLYVKILRVSQSYSYHLASAGHFQWCHKSIMPEMAVVWHISFHFLPKLIIFGIKAKAGNISATDVSAQLRFTTVWCSCRQISDRHGRREYNKRWCYSTIRC